MADRVLSKEDYEEPCCPLKMHTNIMPIPTDRVIEKLDSYLNSNDYSSAEKHLKYWLNEAEIGNDMRGKLTVLNEQIGLYRKLGKENDGINAIECALKLADEMQIGNTISMGTTLVNAATAYKAFGKAEKAYPLYLRAKEIYETLLKGNDTRLGGLYNNMALTVMELGNYREAENLFNKALDVMSQNEHHEPEMAITYCNLADLATAKLGIENAEKLIGDYLDKAEELLNTKTIPQDGYYAFVCEKCAPTFGYYGYFLAEQELMKRARKIYERT